MNPTRRHRLLRGPAYLRTLLLLRLRGVRHGRRPLFRGKGPLIHAWGEVSVGANFRVRGEQFRASFGAAPSGRLILGDGVYLNQGAFVHAACSIELGNHVRLADLAAIYDSNAHEVDEDAGVVTKPVSIEDNVWIGRAAIVLPGVRVGRNSVIGAGAVVTESVPANSLVVGNPARVVRALDASPDYVRP